MGRHVLGPIIRAEGFRESPGREGGKGRSINQPGPAKMDG
jgi:hypothetical protein